MELNVESALQNAPGCFASPSVFSHDSQVCQACPSFDACGTACIATLQALRATINVDDILARHSRAKGIVASASTENASSTAPAAAQPDFSKFLPSVKRPAQKVERKAKEEVAVAQDIDEHSATIINSIAQVNAKALASEWVKSGMVEKIRTDLTQGRNPFASEARQSFRSVACDELLKGTVTKTSLKKAFMSRLGNKKPWSEASASSHVGIIMPALVAFGFAVETSEGYALSPRLRGDNV